MEQRAITRLAHTLINDCNRRRPRPMLKHTVIAWNATSPYAIARILGTVAAASAASGLRVDAHRMGRRFRQFLLKHRCRDTQQWRNNNETILMRTMATALQSADITEKTLPNVLAILDAILHGFVRAVSLPCQNSQEVLCLILSKTSGTCRTRVCNDKMRSWFSVMTRHAARRSAVDGWKPLADAADNNPQITTELRVLGERHALSKLADFTTSSRREKDPARPTSINKLVNPDGNDGIDGIDDVTQFGDLRFDPDMTELLSSLSPSRTSSAIDLEAFGKEWEAACDSPELFCAEDLSLDL